MKEIKVYGLKRTGTNYFKKVIELNYNIFVDENTRGWKHGPYIQDCLNIKPVDSVVIIKHPLSWLVSLYNHIKSSWNFNFFCQHYIWEWTTTYTHWCFLNVKNKVEVIKYEDLIANTQAILDNLTNNFGIDIKGKFVDIKKRVDPSNKVKDDIVDRDYFLNQEYLSMFPVGLRKKLYDTVNSELLEIYKYSMGI